MDDKYCYICTVEAGDSLYAASLPCRDVFPGDLVTLDSGMQGIVKRVVFWDTTTEDYALLTDFVAVDEIVEVYRHVWSKAEESEEQ